MPPELLAGPAAPARDPASIRSAAHQILAQPPFRIAGQSPIDRARHWLGQEVSKLLDNALSGNTTNYAGSAAPGAGYVTGSLNLTSTTPPGPAAGSPLIGAGDTALVTPHDFFGKPRNGRADIGAVQGP